MTKKETINRNIGLAFDFLKEVNKKPAILDRISKAATVEFVEKDFPKKEAATLKKRNRKYIRVKNEFDVN